LPHVEREVFGDPEPRVAIHVLLEVLLPAPRHVDLEREVEPTLLFAHDPPLARVRVPSLREYVLVSQTHPRIERYRRLDSGASEYQDVTEGSLQLETGATFDLAALYADLPD
jgi:hypothetical protein